MILVLDNYDSFTYNLVQLLGRVTDDILVKRNNEITLQEIQDLRPDGILISPGPGRPEDAGVSIETIREFGDRIPILGVCLGHQAIGYAYGGEIEHAPSLMHGRTSAIKHSGTGLFEGISNPFIATRYHSLAISRRTLPEQISITAETEDGVIMGVRHLRLPVEGVQFHPESILTESGERMLRNWLRVQ